MLIRLCVVVFFILMIDSSNGLFKNSQQTARLADDDQASRISKRFAAMSHAHKVKTSLRLRALRRDPAHEALETAETRHPGLAQNDTAYNSTAQPAQDAAALSTTMVAPASPMSSPLPTTTTSTSPDADADADADAAAEVTPAPVQRTPFREFGLKLRARATTLPTNALQESNSASEVRPGERPARPLDLETERDDNMDVAVSRPFTEGNKPARPHPIVHHVMMIRRGDARVQVDDDHGRPPKEDPVDGTTTEGGDEKKPKHEEGADKAKAYLKHVVEGAATKVKANRTSTGYTLMQRTREQIVGAKKSLSKSRQADAATPRVRNTPEGGDDERQAENAIVKHSRGNSTYKTSLLGSRRGQKALVAGGEIGVSTERVRERMEAVPSEHAVRTSTTPLTTTTASLPPPTTTTPPPPPETTTTPTTTTTTTPTTTLKPRVSSERPTTKMSDFRPATSKILSTAVVTSISVLGDWTPLAADAADADAEADAGKAPRHVDAVAPKTKETFEVTYSRTVPGSARNVPMGEEESFGAVLTTRESVRTSSTTEENVATPLTTIEIIREPSTTRESISKAPPTTERSTRLPSTTQEAVRKTHSTEDSVRWTPSSTKASLTPSSTVSSVRRTSSTEEPVRWTPSTTTESVRRAPTTTDEPVRWSPSTSERSVPRAHSTTSDYVPRSSTTTVKSVPKTEASTESSFSLDAVPDEVQLNLRDGITTTRRPPPTTARYAQNHRNTQEVTTQGGYVEYKSGNASDGVAVKGEVTLHDVRRVIEDSVNQTRESHRKVAAAKDRGQVVFDDDDVRRRPKEGAGVDEGEGDVSNYVLASFGVVPIVVGVLLVVRFFLSRRKKIWESEKSPLTFVSTNEWEFPRAKLRLQTVLGQGNFGLVYKAEADDILGERATRLVAVKTVKDNASAREKEDLLRELVILKQIGSHANVVTLLGCCTEKEPSLLILEYVMYGKLLSFLRDNRTRKQYFNFSEETAELTAKDLTSFAYCVARGMEYLASKGIIHRDLAARNVLVDHNKVCKVADFGMSRTVSEPEQIYAQAPAKGALPIRWMAPESLVYRVFTHKSDVWAFGILMWEIVTLGSTPYQNLSAREVIREVRDGHRLARPAHCRAELYRVAATCWAHDPAQRPAFAEVKQQLGALLEQGEPQAYVDLDSYIESIAGGRQQTQHTTQVVNL